MAAHFTHRWYFVGIVLACLSPCAAHAAGFRTGAFAVDVTPDKFPVIVNGNFLPVIADKANDRLHARWLVLDDGKGTRIGLCVVDSCLMPRELLDEAKARIEKATGLRRDRVMISATHTHSAPSVMGCLGTDADPEYPKLLLDRLVDGAKQAVTNLAPAKVGHASVQLPEYTHCRQWIYRPDRMLRDPFGDLTVRANMHPGYENASTIAPTGPSDPELSVLAFQSPDGKPIAVLANYSMHYFGAPVVSSDYYGLFCENLAKRVAGGDAKFVAIMSQGTSGDQHWMDYAAPEKKLTIDAYADALAGAAEKAYRAISFRGDVDLAMTEKELRIPVRAPDEKRLAWARDVVSKTKDGKPTNQPEIYAREAVLLHEKPFRDVKLQAIRVGEVGIAAIPCEVFALTGLKLKTHSRLEKTFTIELANGEEGYIPPPELHPLGGYTTWPARTACLEAEAEPKIVEAVLGLLRDVGRGHPRPIADWPPGKYYTAVRTLKPAAYWPGWEMSGRQAVDAGGNGHDGAYEDGVVFYHEGPQSPALASPPETVNRCPHYAGGRMRAELPKLGERYSVSMWFWNGLASDARAVTAYLFSRSPDGDKEAPGDHLGIGGTYVAAGKLIFFNGNRSNTVLAGSTPIAPRTWNHVVLVRDGKKVTAYLNGRAEPEIQGEAEVTLPPDAALLFLGGRSDNFANLEGRIDEAAVFDRALKAEEAVALFTAAGRLTPSPGVPGEGRGEGSTSNANHRPAIPDSQDPHPNPLPEFRERGQEAHATSSALHPDAPKSPQDSMAAMKLKDGFEIELVAAEPMVLDPVALAWGPDGRLWVAEYADYPYGVRGDMKKPGGSRVRVLEDSDGDGKYDKSTLFLEGLNFANGVLPWRKGVLVTAAPEIIYAEDTDGDGKADKKEVLYTGFTEGNPQLRVNGLRWGLDNWIYCANGWSSTGKVRSAKTGKEIDIAGRDLRIRPDTGELEAETGMTEYGRDRDDYGEWFGCDNSHPMWHFVLSDRYTRRNPHVAPPDPRVQLMLPANPRVFPIRKPEKRYHSWDQANHFTSACSTMVYRDELLFPRDDGTHAQHAFVCEPVHNLIHHEVMTPDGVTFKCARPADEQSMDFLASSDTWFRPSMVTTGPDGALWVADMYRFMIEHPDWLNDQGKADYKPFYRLGEERGRIYRIYRKGHKPRQIPRMDRMRTIELCRAAIDSPGGWQRDTAQMMLLWNKARMVGEARGELQGVVYGSQNPLARMQALCTLDGLGALRPEVLVAATRDEDPAVRRHAVRIAEGFGDAPAVVDAMDARVGDEDVRVRLQVACTLGEWKSDKAGKLLAKLAKYGAADPYVAAAVVSSSLPHFDAAVGGAGEGVNASVNKTDPGGPLVRGLLFTALGAARDAEMADLVSDVFNTDSQDRLTAAQMDLAADWLDAMDARGKPAAQWLDGLDKAVHAEVAGSLRPVLTRAFMGARRDVSSSDRPPAERAGAARLLGREPKFAGEDRKLLAGLLSPTTPGDVQRAAVSSLARLGGDDLPALALAGWASHSPELRGAVVDALLRREPWSAALLDALEKQQVSPADIDVPRRQRLLGHASEKIRQRAQAMLGGETATNRQKVVEAHRGVVSMIDKADGSRGAKLFAQNCAVCHRVNETGQDVGPNLASVRGWTPEMLLTGVLDPNRQVDPKYVAYTVTLTNGEIVYGVITAETGGSLTMKGLDGKERPVVRTEVKSIVSTGKSLMPDGFESAMKDQELADLILFVKAPDGVR